VTENGLFAYFTTRLNQDTHDFLVKYAVPCSRVADRVLSDLPRDLSAKIADQPERRAGHHVVARCVRCVWLRGSMSTRGGDYSYRKEWVLERLRFLAGIFSTEICA
jgi:hypothetical protein